MAFASPSIVGFQGHHIIPLQWKDHAIFRALGARFNIDDESRNRLDLPNKSSIADAKAAGLATLSSDNAQHSGGHAKYNAFVERLLNGLGAEYLDPDTKQLKPGISLNDLDREVKKLQHFLADGLTTQLADDGKTTKAP
jgi:A nuclease family of the HNH/ENDO VII superfamily with conserved AHH